MKRTAATALALATIVLLLAGCSQGGSGTASVAHDCKPIAKLKTIHPGVLTVRYAEYPPNIYTDGGTVSGVEGELIKRFAKAVCLPLDIKQSSFTAIIEGLKAGQIDFSSNAWAPNEERKKLFEVSDPILFGYQGILTRDGASPDELIGKRVGTVAGYLFVPDVQAMFGKENVALYQSDAEGYADLKSRRIDGFISGQDSLGYLKKQYGDTSTHLERFQDPRVPLTMAPSESVVLISKGNTTLLTAMNKVIEEFRASPEFKKQLEADGLTKDAGGLK